MYIIPQFYDHCSISLRMRDLLLFEGPAHTLYGGLGIGDGFENIWPEILIPSATHLSLQAHLHSPLDSSVTLHTMFSGWKYPKPSNAPPASPNPTPEANRG